MVNAILGVPALPTLTAIRALRLAELTHDSGDM